MPDNIASQINHAHLVAIRRKQELSHKRQELFHAYLLKKIGVYGIGQKIISSVEITGKSDFEIQLCTIGYDMYTVI